MKLPLSRIAEFLGISWPRNDADKRVATGYSIDSRTIDSGNLFFAVKGDRFDGHDFLGQAFERGAVGAVVSRERLPALTAGDFRGRPAGEAPLLTVEDPLGALQMLATAVRQLWARPVIAVTGSVGKTTTKEAIAHVLSIRYRVHKSEGNFNNHFGLPLMLLKLQPEDDLAVVELGMSHLGEITALAQIARPEMGVVTNVGPVHLEFFSSVREIARAKYELIESLPAGGTAVLNADDEYVSQFGRSFKGRVVTYGFSQLAAVRAENIEYRGSQGSSFEIVIPGRREPALVGLVGRHNVLNALAAIAVALEREIPLAEAASSLESLTAAERRGEVVRIGNIQVINDCYNSNPKALAAMVEVLAGMPAGRRIVVAGEMLELGPAGEEMHGEAGEHMADRGIDIVLGVRGLAASLVEAARRKGISAEFVATPEEAGAWLARETREGDVVLLKASRGVKLENALAVWRQGSRGQGTAQGSS